MSLSRDEFERLLQMNIDWHVHTNKSDGEYDSSKLVEMAQKAELVGIAITDHDTIEGVRESAGIVLPEGFQLINGVELSCISSEQAELDPMLNIEFHILVYGYDLEKAIKNKIFEPAQNVRRTRAENIIDNLQAQIGDGIDIKSLDLTKCKSLIPGNYNKPYLSKRDISHYLFWLIQENSEGNEYLSRLKKEWPKDSKDPKEELLFLDKKVLGEEPICPPYSGFMVVEQAINISRSFDGQSIFSHPGETLEKIKKKLPSRYTGEEREKRATKYFIDYLDYLVNLGLSGIEVDSPKNKPGLRDILMSEFKDRGLLFTRGSDFHDEAFDDYKIGHFDYV